MVTSAFSFSLSVSLSFSLSLSLSLSLFVSLSELIEFSFSRCVQLNLSSQANALTDEIKIRKSLRPAISYCETKRGLG